jgi:acyl dehydratase
MSTPTSALDLTQVGKPGRPFAHTYTWKDCVLYALGVGARLPDELPFLYEQRGPRVLPTFAVVPALVSMADAIARARASFAHALHGEQSIILHRPIPPQGTLSTTATITGIYDKGKAALILVECRTVDAQGAPLFDTVWSIFVRGAGGFGGERGPAAREVELTGGRPPDFEVTEATTPEQAALYRLSGDVNPLHIAPEFAAAVGFERPILHGLCTYGHAGRAILRHACGGDPARLRSFTARFAGVVLPGDTLTTRGWRTDTTRGPGTHVINVTRADGTAVLTHGVAEVTPEGP